MNGRFLDIPKRFALPSRAKLSLALLLVVAAFVLSLSYVSARYQETANSPLREASYGSDWIRAAGEPSHAGYFRKRFDLPGKVKHAWIKIAATDAFEVNVNRNPLGKVYLWRPTRPFQNGTSEKGQVLLPQEPAMALNFPREYQWDGHDTWKLPTYLEITSSLKQGKNIIAIEVESRLAPARTSFVGEIQLWSGEIIPIQSDDSWLGEPVPTGPQFVDWTELFYWDKNWRPAVKADAPSEKCIRSLAEAIYQEPFAGNWIRHPDAPSEAAVHYRATWNIREPIDEAWLRLVANRSFEVLVNGVRVRVPSIKPPDLDNGEWVFGRGSARSPVTRPALLDPDEVGANFVGNRFETPRKGHRNLEAFRNPFSPKLTPFRYIRTYNRAQAPGEYDPKRTLAESRRTPETPDLFPEKLLPNALKYDSSVGGYLSYGITNLLRQGPNEIEIRCLDKANSNWSSQIAVDGGGITKRGTRIPFIPDSDWTAKVTQSSFAQASSSQDFLEVQKLGPAKRRAAPFPSMQFRGNSISPTNFPSLLKETFARTLTVTTIGLAVLFVFSWILGRRRVTTALGGMTEEEPETSKTWRGTAELLFSMMLAGTVALLAGILLESSWVERHEILWFLDGTMWRGTIAVAAIAALIVGVLNLISLYRLKPSQDENDSWVCKIRELPKTRVWFHLCIWVLLFGALLRGYKLDLQPLDDDEYASTQAIMSILETGSPSFVPEDVYYTRSPLFHYLSAAIALPFGGNLWSLRLQSVFWGVATAALAYLCGSKLLRSPWVGFFSMLLICVHPFEIFTGHVVRFYQMQQFFALLTVFCFCRGFVTDQCQKYRVATLISFLLAVMSQEISVSMGPSLVLGYLMFAKDFGWKKNITLILVSAVVAVLIVLDYVVFQTLCLTRTEGVSPSIEAAVKPHFWYPMNFLALFIGYSRLHIVPSFFLLVGMPLLWRERNRNTLAFLTFMISGIVMSNVLVTNVSLRYMYWLFPLWILLAVDGLRLLLCTMISVVYDSKRSLNRYVNTFAICGIICFAAILGSWSPWRIAGSYELRILGDSTGAVRWVQSQKREGDRVAITEPHTHCAFLESGKCDFDIAIPLLYDFAVMRDGVLVDRNGGGEILSNVDQLIHEISQGDRVWVLLNREKFRTRGKNMRWEYPGARFESFVRKNFELKHRTYLWSVFLWDPARGHFQPFQLQE